MSGSYKRINYDLRPAKSVERKMLLALLRRLCSNEKISEYAYVGMGSTFFSDFKLLHKEFHLEKMVSIEKEKIDQERFEFNVPYNCIDLEFGISTEIIPVLKIWDKKCIVWLDYDTYLDPYMFSDIELIFKRLTNGSFYLFTSCRHLMDNEEFYTVESFKSKFGTLAPYNLQVKDLSLENSISVIQNMIINKIVDVIENRNLSLPNEEKLCFNRIRPSNYVFLN